MCRLRESLTDGTLAQGGGSVEKGVVAAAAPDSCYGSAMPKDVDWYYRRSG